MNLFGNRAFYLFCISMLPVIELRGGMPIAAASGIPFWEAYLICVIGNMLPVPFLILFSKTVLSWLARQKKIGQFFQRIIDKADAKSKSLGKYELLGLCLFVAIPAPGTGAWTGSLIAALLRMRVWQACLSILLGVMIAGFIMGGISYGVSGMLRLV